MSADELSRLRAYCAQLEAKLHDRSIESIDACSRLCLAADALGNLCGFAASYVGVDAAASLYPEIAKARLALDAIRSGNPLLHPDTVRLDWLNARATPDGGVFHTNVSCYSLSWCRQSRDLRAAIDSAMPQGGAK